MCMMMVMMMMMMTLMKLVNSATKFRHGIDKFYQPNSGLRGSKTWDEAIYTYVYIYMYTIIYTYVYIYIYICVCIQLYTHMCIYIYIHNKYKYIYIYTHAILSTHMYIYIYYKDNSSNQCREMASNGPWGDDAGEGLCKALRQLCCHWSGYHWALAVELMPQVVTRTANFQLLWWFLTIFDIRRRWRLCCWSVCLCKCGNPDLSWYLGVGHFSNDWWQCMALRALK